VAGSWVAHAPDSPTQASQHLRRSPSSQPTGWDNCAGGACRGHATVGGGAASAPARTRCSFSRSSLHLRAAALICRTRGPLWSWGGVEALADYRGMSFVVASTTYDPWGATSDPLLVEVRLWSVGGTPATPLSCSRPPHHRFQGGRKRVAARAAGDSASLERLQVHNFATNRFTPLPCGRLGSIVTASTSLITPATAPQVTTNRSLSARPRCRAVAAARATATRVAASLPGASARRPATAAMGTPTAQTRTCG